jgi:hypothetical protein
VACLHHGCDGFFSLSALSGLLAPSLFANLLREVQKVELTAAAVGDLESCPFCGFGVEIQDPTMTVFKCLNALCGIDTCR